MTEPLDRIAAVIREDLEVTAPPGVHAIAEAARAHHGDAVEAVLFYGGCLRGGDVADSLVDLYLLVGSYGAVHSNPVARLANAVLPPNVYYLEAPCEDGQVRAKYAVLSLPHLEKLVSAGTLQSYFWARFAQPVRLLWARDGDVEGRVVRALARAVMTAADETLPLLEEAPKDRRLFVRAFQETYRSELRSEKGDRAAELCEAFGTRYDRLAELLAHGAVTDAARRRAPGRWRRRRVAGKLLSVLRLMKAAFTFTDGARYLLWKIERHSGVHQELTPWQRRHPILASSILFWRLYRKGAFR